MGARVWWGRGAGKKGAGWVGGGLKNFQRAIASFEISGSQVSVK